MQHMMAIPSPIGRGTLSSPVVYRIMNKHGSRATVHILCRYTSSTTILFLTSFISIDRQSLTETSVTLTILLVGRYGTVNNGGTNSHTFAKDGGMSYLGRHPTWIFASSVHMAHRLQTCWHIRPSFHSSWIILAEIGKSLQKTKKE